MPYIVHGRTVWSGRVDDAGHRTYQITFLIQTDDPDDGPALVIQTPGLPVPGTYWDYGNDVDVWAWCRPDMDVRFHGSQDNEPWYHWLVTCTFSTKPPSRDSSQRQRCADARIEDPLLEPQKVSGSFTKYTEEFTRNHDGTPIVNSAWEQIRGPQVEFDRNRPQVRVEQNVADLELATFSNMVDTLNDAPLWGLPARAIKLTDASWERKYHGACSVYYTRSFTFDIAYRPNLVTGLPEGAWDRKVMDEGAKVLHGHWGTGSGSVGWIVDDFYSPAGVFLEEANYLNPAHFIRAKDRNGENTRNILNGRGVPYDPSGATTGTGDDEIGIIDIRAYGESNFLLLGIPTVF